MYGDHWHSHTNKNMEERDHYRFQLTAKSDGPHTEKPPQQLTLIFPFVVTSTAGGSVASWRNPYKGISQTL